MRFGILPLASSILFSLFPATICIADTPKGETREWNFVKDIQPILQSRCLRCHGENKKRRGGLSLKSAKAAGAPADSGKLAIVPGHSSKSELIQRILSENEDVRMPPSGPRLTKEQVAALKGWIDAGADWPVSEDEEHWAYVKPTRGKLPDVKDSEWIRNPIDRFVLAKLEQKQLTPSKAATRAKLIRRVYLDLIGFPPTPEQVNAFLQDDRPDAYERVVDGLLASPHYGERWARHWLDLARYADSNGFQRDGFRTVWPYRDWVIKAFNNDMPFDQFTIEQIAGDLLPKATLSQKIATGFNRCTTVNVEAGVDREEDRVNAIFDRVSTTSTVWLGTTMVCAQCHNHKYDPFTQKDYYQLFAYFNNTGEETKEGSGANREFIGPKVTLPLSPEQEKLRQEVQSQRTEANKQLKKRVKDLSTKQAEWEKTIQATKAKWKKVPANIRKIVTTVAKKRNKKQKQQLADYFTNQTPEVKQLRASVKKLDQQLKKLEPATSLVMSEKAKPRKTHIFKRGEFLSKLQQVQPDTPAALHSLSQSAPPNRLGLARWLVDSENPLTARVTVNRFWSEFFGHGLVATLEDFGSQAEPPTHPQLLDWLAVEFMENGWSVKHIHRLIVTSATYRQASTVTEDLLQADPKNKLYARGPRIRLSAEAIRDNALAVSGLLSRKLGGPPVYPPQPNGLWNVTGRVDNKYYTSKGEDRYRRGLYTIWRRSSPYPSFVAFDAPDRSSCVVKRPRTNTPLQALTLMNDPVYIEAAVAFADRILQEKPKADVQERIRYGFQTCLIRQPSNREIHVLERVYRQALARYQKAPKDAQKVVSYCSNIESKNHAEVAAWFQVTTVLLNLDETITKD